MLKPTTRDRGPFVVAEGDYEENLYFEGTLDGQPYFYCHVQRYEDLGYIHAYAATKFTLGACKELRKDFRTIKDVLLLKGIQVLVALMPTTENITKWTKFTRLMGFEPPTDITVAQMPCKRVMMEV